MINWKAQSSSLTHHFLVALSSCKGIRIAKSFWKIFAEILFACAKKQFLPLNHLFLPPFKAPVSTQIILYLSPVSFLSSPPLCSFPEGGNCLLPPPPQTPGVQSGEEISVTNISWGEKEKKKDKKKKPEKQFSWIAVFPVALLGSCFFLMFELSL